MNSNQFILVTTVVVLILSLGISSVSHESVLAQYSGVYKNGLVNGLIKEFQTISFIEADNQQHGSCSAVLNLYQTNEALIILSKDIVTCNLMIQLFQTDRIVEADVIDTSYDHPLSDRGDSWNLPTHEVLSLRVFK